MIDSLKHAHFEMQPLEARIQLSGAADLTHSTSALPIHGYRFDVASIGSKVFFPGDDLIQIYDAAKGTWSDAVPPVSLQLDVVARVGSKVVFGGPLRGTGQPTNIVNIYDSVTDTWSTSKLPRKVVLQSSAAFGDEALFFTRTTGDNTYAFLFNSKRLTWKIISPPPDGLPGQAFTLGDRAYLNSSRFFYDFPRHRWMKTDLLTYGQNLKGIGTRLVINNGNSTRVIDTVTGQESTAVTHGDNGGGSVTTVGSKLLIAGSGAGLLQQKNDVVDVYDVSTDAWSTTNLSASRGGIGAATAGTHAVFGGGVSGVPHPVLYDNVDIYTDAQPAAVLSGAVTGSIGHHDHVTVINSGDADLTAGYTVQLYASTDRTLHGAILVGSMAVSSTLTAGTTSLFNIRTRIPRGAPAGKYHLLAAVKDTAGNITPIAAEESVFRVGGDKIFQRTSRHQHLTMIRLARL